MTDKRDRSIEILLRQRRESDVASDVSPQCLDGEALAAWVDGTLAETARADAEQHAARCARCQALLASMARTMPEADARAWWQVLSAKWLVPVAAVATALLIWVSVGQSPKPAPLPTSSAAAPTDTGRVPTVAASAPTAQGQNGQAQTDSRATVAANAPVPNKETAEGQAEPVAAPRLFREQKPAAAPPQRLDALDKTAGAISPRVDPRSADVTRQAQAGPTAASAPPPPVPAQPLPAAPQQVLPPAPQQQQQAAPVFPVPPVAEAVTITSEAASKPAAGRGSGTGGGRVAFAAASEIRSPQPDYRWRIVPPSGIQRSVDGGVTWSVVNPVLAKDAVAQRDSSQMVLTTGSSPSRDICWIVGRAGVVLLTTDGATWQRRSIPETVDLTAVRAVDARSATVTTADGRQFVTADSGVTWTLSRQDPDLEQD